MAASVRRTLAHESQGAVQRPGSAASNVSRDKPAAASQPLAWRPAGLPRGHGSREEGQRNQVGQGFAHAGERSRRKEDPRPGEPAAKILHRQQPPQQGRQDQPREDVEQHVDLDDPPGIAPRQHPGERGRQDAPPAIGQVVDRPPQLRRPEERMIGDLGVGDSVVGPGVLEDVHRLGMEFVGSFFCVIRAVELHERRQAPYRVPETGDQAEEEEDRPQPEEAHRPATGCGGWQPVGVHQLRVVRIAAGR